MKIWFIYAYKRVDTGKCVYVGSTLNPHDRHRLRIKKSQNGFPFDRVLAADPDAYSYEIVEALFCLSSTVVRRENQWMDVLGTFRTDGCFNFQRANITVPNYEAWLAARKAAQSTPEFLARKALKQKEVMANYWDGRRKQKPPLRTREEINAAMRAAWTPERKAAQQGALRKAGAAGGRAARDGNLGWFARRGAAQKGMQKGVTGR